MHIMPILLCSQCFTLKTTNLFFLDSMLSILHWETFAWGTNLEYRWLDGHFLRIACNQKYMIEKDLGLSLHTSSRSFLHFCQQELFCLSLYWLKMIRHCICLIVSFKFYYFNGLYELLSEMFLFLSRVQHIQIFCITLSSLIIANKCSCTYFVITYQPIHLLCYYRNCYLVSILSG